MFDFNKIDDFDEHINLSIPNYDELIAMILKISEYFVENDSFIYDIGCSTGSFLKKMIEVNHAKSFTAVGIDNSRLIPADKNPSIRFIKTDLKDYADYQKSAFITSIFTLQFLSHTERTLVLKRIKMALDQYGCFILCEKVNNTSGKVQDMMNSLYYQFKLNTFSADDILKKEVSLRGNMHIKTLDTLFFELADIGHPEIFWKSYNFVGILVTKEKR